MRKPITILVITATMLMAACNINTEPQTEPVTETSAEVSVTSETTTEFSSETTSVETSESVLDSNCVVFGHYEQDGNLDNGPEPIVWDILDKEDGKMLLLSRYILDCHSFIDVSPYARTPEKIKWHSSLLRTWMNKEFLNNAFDKDEQQLILTTELKTEKNPIYNVDGGKTTKDKVFCLSADEVIKYFDFNLWDEERQSGYSQALLAEATPYAVSNHAYVYVIPEEEARGFIEMGYTEDLTGKEYSYWWLRSPGMNNRSVCYVSVHGFAGWDYNYFGGMVEVGVRPAIWIKSE